MGCPPYSHDLAPCTFWLCPKLKKFLKGQTFPGIPDIQQVTTLLQGIPENVCQHYFWQWHHHLMKCTDSQEENFEGHSSHLCTGKQIF
jgi:hypothetical protein